MLNHSTVERRSLLLRATLGVLILADLGCSDSPTAPAPVIDCVEAELARFPIIDARDRLSHGFEGEVRNQLLSGLAQLEIGLRQCDGAAVQSNLAEVRRVIAPTDAAPFGNESSDVSAINLALDEVEKVLLGQASSGAGE
jgi:hypothetical protein